MASVPENGSVWVGVAAAVVVVGAVVDVEAPLSHADTNTASTRTTNGKRFIRSLPKPCGRRHVRRLYTVSPPVFDSLDARRRRHRRPDDGAVFEVRRQTDPTVCASHGRFISHYLTCQLLMCNISLMAVPESPLQRELRQRRPFQSAAHEAIVGLLRTADLIRRHAAAVVEPHGITTQQFNVLRILRGAGGDGLPTLEVGARMVEQTPGVTRLLDRLEAKDLVRRQRCPNDRPPHLSWDN